MAYGVLEAWIMRTQLLLFFASVTLTACGSTPVAPLDGGTDSGARDASDAASDASLDVVPDVPPLDAPADAVTDAPTDVATDGANLPYGGTVSINVLVSPSGTRQHVAGAYFGAGVAPGGDGIASCAGAQVTMGDCCYLPPPPNNPPPPPPDQSAGTITLRNVTAGATLAMLAYSSGEGGPSGYFTFQWNTPVWNGGDTIEATAPGATIGAFTLSTPATVPIAGIMPPWDSNTPLTVPLNQDFHVSWQPDASAKIMTLLMAAEQNGNGFPSHGAVVCLAPDSQGSFTVPSALFAQFQSGDICSSCGLARTSSALTQASNANVALAINVYGGGTATFQ